MYHPSFTICLRETVGNKDCSCVDGGGGEVLTEAAAAAAAAEAAC